MLVEPVSSKTTFANGELLLPPSAQEKPQQGRVIAIGTGRINARGKRIPFDVLPGDLVLFAMYSGTQFKSDGKSFLILKEADVLAVID